MLFTMGLQVVTQWADYGYLGHWKNPWQVWILALGSSGCCYRQCFEDHCSHEDLPFQNNLSSRSWTDKLNSITRESLTGIRVVRAYNAEDYQDKKFEEANDEVTRLNLFVNRLMAIMNPIMMGIEWLEFNIYWIRAYIINDASLTERLPLFSDMVVFMSYAMQVVMGFLLMGALFIVLPRTLVSAGRINQVLDLHSSIENPSHPQTANPFCERTSGIPWCNLPLLSKLRSSCGTCYFQSRSRANHCFYWFNWFREIDTY